MNIKSIILGGLLPLIFVAVGVGVLVSMRPPVNTKASGIGADKASLLTKMPSAEVQYVRALAELSETLDIPLSGTVVPYREIALAAEAAGRIIEKAPNVRSGNFVKKDQVLLRIDPRDYELTVERLTRKRDQELASLEELKQDVENTKRLIDVSEQEYELAGQEVKRYQSLGSSFASAAELDQARRSLLSSMNQKVTLQNQLRTFEARATRLELAAKLAETELEQAALDLERTVVRAPVDGRIVSEEVEQDSYVQRGTQLLVIEDTEKVEIAVNLRMNQLYWVLDKNELSTDQLINAADASRYELPPVPVKVQFNLAGREAMRYEWDGVLARYDGPGMDPQSRTIPVRVVVDNPTEYRVDGRPVDNKSRSGPSTLVRGMFVDVKILARPATQLLLVPKLSIKPATSSNRIWKFTPDESAFEVVKKRYANEIVETNSSTNPVVNSNDDQEAATANVEEKPNPDEWQAGFLKVIDGVQVVGAYEPDVVYSTASDNDASTGAASSPVAGTSSESTEYWICEVPGGMLKAGDMVVVTPLPGIEGMGTDTIRVPDDTQEPTPATLTTTPAPTL